MSTKIRNGYRLAPGTDLLAFTSRLREVMNPVRMRLDARLLMGRAITAVDWADARGEARPRNALATALAEFGDEQRAMDPRQAGHDPNRFEASFGRDAKTGRTLCLLYADQDEYRRAWEALAEVEPYGYWDDTDQPTDVTGAEWRERRQAWGRVMPGWAPPAGCMLSFSLRPALSCSAGMAELTRPRDDDDAEAARRKLLRLAARPKRDRARDLAVNLLAGEAARRAGPGRGTADAIRVASRFLFAAPDGPDNCEAVAGACEAALNDDVTNFIIGNNSDRSVIRPLDLTAVHLAVASHLDKTTR